MSGGHFDPTRQTRPGRAHDARRRGSRRPLLPRVHVGLLDLGHVTRRRHGGAGFTLGGPCLEVLAEADGPLEEVRGLERCDERARQEVDRALDAFQRAAGPLHARFTLTRGLPLHVGLGSKTALLLTILQAASEIAERPLQAAALALLTGRGGTSGVGVNSFFSGGFLTDGGYPAAPALPFGPSSVSRPDHVPPPLCRLAVPAGWRFTLLLPRCARLSDGAERRVFSQHTPLPEAEVLRAIATLYHGIVPAIATDDLGENVAMDVQEVRNRGPGNPAEKRHDAADCHQRRRLRSPVMAPRPPGGLEPPPS